MKGKRRKNARDQYKSQAERNSIELSNKNREMVIKIQELEDLKSKYQKSLYNLNNLESKVFLKKTKISLILYM